VSDVVAAVIEIVPIVPQAVPEINAAPAVRPKFTATKVAAPSTTVLTLAVGTTGPTGTLGQTFKPEQPGERKSSLSAPDTPQQ